MTMPFQRLFLAIPVTEKLSHDIRLFLDRIRAKKLSVRWVHPEDAHVTLHFFGNISEDKRKIICEIARACANRSVPFQLGLNGLGYFPAEDKPRIVWARPNGDIEALFNLQKRLCQSLETAGFPLETRSFTPHVTLGRVKGILTPELLNCLEFPQTSFEIIKSIALYQSVSGVSETRYEILHEFPFAKITPSL